MEDREAKPEEIERLKEEAKRKLPELIANPEEQMELAKEIKAARAIPKVKRILEEAMIRVYCKTCDEVFLRISEDEFLEKSVQFYNVMKPDLWMLNAEIHCFKNPTHMVVQSKPQWDDTDISEIIRKMKNFSLEKALRQREEAKKYAKI